MCGPRPHCPDRSSRTGLQIGGWKFARAGLLIDNEPEKVVHTAQAQSRGWPGNCSGLDPEARSGCEERPLRSSCGPPQKASSCLGSPNRAPGGARSPLRAQGNWGASTLLRRIDGILCKVGRIPSLHGRYTSVRDRDPPLGKRMLSHSNPAAGRPLGPARLAPFAAARGLRVDKCAEDRGQLVGAGVAGRPQALGAALHHAERHGVADELRPHAGVGVGCAV